MVMVRIFQETIPMFLACTVHAGGITLYLRETVNPCSSTYAKLNSWVSQQNGSFLLIITVASTPRRCPIFCLTLLTASRPVWMCKISISLWFCSEQYERVWVSDLFILKLYNDAVLTAEVIKHRMCEEGDHKCWVIWNEIVVAGLKTQSRHSCGKIVAGRAGYRRGTRVLVFFFFPGTLKGNPCTVDWIFWCQCGTSLIYS
jgi:hypothetical protein